LPGRVKETAFDDFVKDVEPRLRHALIARFGPDRGREATAEALAFAWERWHVVQGLSNPVAYLFTVGRSRTRRWSAFFPFTPRPDVRFEAKVEPGLTAALASLPAKQRTSVLLVVGLGWSYGEVAQLLGVSRATVQTHVDRALAHLRRSLGVDPEAGESEGVVERDT
jgi:RNA polymerase sigma factor (sigma-70 family)